MNFRASAATLKRLSLSIFMTVTVFAVGARAGDSVRCESLWSRVEKLSNRALYFPATSPIKNERLYWQIKNGWLALGREPSRAERDELIRGIVAVLQQQKFNVKVSKTDIVVTDKADPRFRHSFSAGDVFGGLVFGQIERLSLTRSLAARARRLQGAEMNENGLRIESSLHSFSHFTDSQLQTLLSAQMKILSKKKFDVAAGIEAAVLTSEILVRRGFTVEIVASQRKVFLVSIISSRVKNQFTETIDFVKKTIGGWFVMDPTFFAEAPKSGGVSDTLNFDYSFNIRRLWTDPEALTTVTPTLVHEIHHLENARRWLTEPDNLELQAFNGFLWTNGAEALTRFSYKSYYQLDEITAALGDTLNSQDPKDVAYYAKRTHDLINGIESRIDVIRYLIETGQFSLHRSSAARFLQVRMVLGSMMINSNVGFTYNFRDLNLETPRHVIVERVEERLDALAKRLEQIRAQLPAQEPLD